jgi:CheY-like chemotaxis protein
MVQNPEFLVVDDHLDNRFLLTKTLNRKFPDALLQECQDSAAAVMAVKRASLSAVIMHRSADVEGLSLLEILRKANPTIPILFVSGANHRDEALRAGATAFLNYDAWLRVGTVVEDMLKDRP